MAGKEIVLSVMLITMFSPEASPWTIDLPEVRKLHFKHEHHEHNTKEGESDKLIYDNIENNSPLTEHENVSPHDIFRKNYADDFEYLGYRSKEVHKDGNKYLEGLQVSIDKYARTLEYCKKRNFTQEPEENAKSEDKEPDFNLSLSDKEREICEQATRSREHVRRLSELAVFTTKQLQDLEYESRYRKLDEEREKELLMKLAFFLDELAYYTGFKPHVKYPEKKEVEETTVVPVTTDKPLFDLNFLNVPDDVRNRMIECLKMNSSEPAPDRCAFPLPLPPILRRLFNMTDSRANDSDTNSEISQQSFSEQLSRELASYITSPSETLATSDTSGRQKRSIDGDPLINVLQYYLKYNVWLNSNLKPITNDKQIDKSDYNVANELKMRKSKRSIDEKQTSHLRPREDPLQIENSHFGNPRDSTDAERKNQQEKISLYLDKIRNSDSSTAKKHAQGLEKTLKSRLKRAVYYGKPIRPKVSEDPYQDISGYVKSRPGVNYNPSITQAAMVRAGLEAAFQNGNIEVVRRYGSNLNPLVPFPFFFGILESVADI